jgi:hypothetical protein
MEKCALALLIASGAVHRWWAGSWSTSEEPAASAARLADVPRTIADWDGHSQEINPRELEIAEVAGHLLRRYVRRGTHEAVTVLIVCGRPGPICVHTPDICFSGQGFEIVGEKTHFTAGGREGLPKAEMFKADMSRRRPDGRTERLRVYWSWKAGGPWRAPTFQRLVFGGCPALYKLYLVCSPAPGAELPEQDPCVDFMADLLPVLDEALSPTS